MMSEIDALVIIPAYRRPEMLAVTLEYIAKADGADRNLYLFSVDEGFDPEIHKVISEFPLEYSIRCNKRRGNGNSSNILSAYRAGYMSAKKLGIPLIHLIEEDTWVAKDYFSFHNRAHKQFADVFCISACRNQNIKSHPVGNSAQVYKHDSYQSLGVSFMTEYVLWFAFHDNDVYYRNPELYIKSLFPNRTIPAIFSEQDGLIGNLMHNHSLKTLYPCIPRACHVGWYGAGLRKGKQLEGTLDEKIAKLKTMTSVDFNRLTAWKDIELCNLNGCEDVQLQELSIKL